MVDINRGVAVFVRFLRSRILVSAVLAIACTVTVFATASASYSVTVRDGQSVYSLEVISKDPYEILSDANISVGEFDALDLTLFTGGKDSIISINRTFNVTVEADSNAISLHLSGGTVTDALAEAEVALAVNDSVTPPLDTVLTPDMTITVARAFEIIVYHENKSSSLDLVDGTVQDALIALGLIVNEYDIVTPSLDTPLTGGMKITLDRVTYTETVEVEEIPFNSIEEKSDSIYEGEREKKQAGEPGKKTITTRNKFYNGEMVESVLISEKVDQEPVDEKWLVGTKKKELITTTKPITTAGSKKTITTKQTTTKKTDESATKTKASTSLGNPSVKGSCDGKGASYKGKVSKLIEPSWLNLNSQGLPTSYVKYIDGLATAYYGENGSLQTATGVQSKPGYIAVNPKQIPYGTELYIVSHDGKYVYGYAIAVDTGGFAKDGKIICDLFFNTSKEVYNFGVRSVRIYVLK